MRLIDFIGKNVYAGSIFKGICLGVGISPKNFAVKYLLCSSLGERPDFCVNVSAIEEIDENIYLSRLRPVFPKNCAKIFMDLPIYSQDGAFLGHIADLEMQNYVALQIFTDRGSSISVSLLAACRDAVIVRKETSYPLGQRIPAPVVSEIFDKKETLVTKSNLRQAIQKGALIKLTLSLAPFRR
ncbi:MAG: hypothetical protein IJX96_02620 [Clostridia bacterium]|nr:hypothetical protein [Clostridia bacterium]